MGRNDGGSGGGWRAKMERARRLHRPSLKDWERDGMHEAFPAYARSLDDGVRRGQAQGKHRRSRKEKGSERGAGSTGTGAETAAGPVVFADASELSVEDFVERCERPGVPAVVRGVPDGVNCAGGDGGGNGERWPALERWDLNALDEDRELRERYFKCGEDDDGKSVKVKLKHFLRYLRTTKDDSPLYIFDSNFDEDRVAKKLLDHYRVPPYFDEDLFGLVSERRRPPYRWFLVGPERSGTTVHVDPLGTSAWNTLLHGRKRWVLFPPHVARSVVEGRGLVGKDEDDEPVHYFMNILPRIKRRYGPESPSGSSSSGCTVSGNETSKAEEVFACFEFTQEPGETVFIPNGWWHAVLNLTDTVGVTQNYCSQRNFDVVWTKTRSGRKKMAWKWLGRLDAEYPHLAKRARRINRADRFTMKYDPIEVRKRREAERRRKRMKKEVKRRKKQQRNMKKSNKKKQPNHAIMQRTDEDSWEVKRELQFSNEQNLSNNKGTMVIEGGSKIERQAKRSRMVSP